MTKAILVVDMPKSCMECSFFEYVGAPKAKRL